MRIDGPNPLLGPALLAALFAREEAATPDKPFADAKPAPALPTPAAGTLIPPPATSVAMLVALSAEAPAERRRRAIIQAERGLDALERLREELAAGIPSPERLRELAAWSSGFEMPDDPELAELARDIELRVRVELAKHDISI